MAEEAIASIRERLTTLEKEKRSTGLGWLSAISPILVALFGYYFQQQLEDAQTEIRENELEIRRIDSAQRIMSALFEEDYEEARALQSLFDALLADSVFHESLGTSIDQYFQSKFDRIARQPNLGQDDVAALQQAVDDAATFDSDATPAAEMEVNLHVVLVSLIRDQPGKFARLVGVAEEITADPSVPDAEIWCSNTGIGYLALTVGRHRLDQAWAVGEQVQKAGWDERRGLSPQFYVTRGDHLYRKVWPGSYDTGSDPCD